MSAWIVVIAAWVAMIAVALNTSRRSNLTSDSQLGPVTFSDDVHVKMRRRPIPSQYVPLKTMSGWLRLGIHGEVIAIRCLGLPRPVAAVLGLDWTFDAPNFTLDVSKVSKLFSIPGVGDDHVVLHGRDRRGRKFDIALQPRTSTVRS